MTPLNTRNAPWRMVAVALGFQAGPLALAPGFTARAMAQQSATIAAGIDVRASADSMTPYVEQTIAVNPLDPNHLVGASMKAEAGGMVVVVLTSRDGGRSWSEVRVEACGWDPWLAFHGSGTVLLACLKPGGGPDPVLVLRSEDGGTLWQDPTVIMPEGSSFDRPTIVADQTGGATGGSVHVVAAHNVRSRSGRTTLVVPAVVTSRDGGRTFSPPVRLQATNTWAMVGTPVVLPDGRLGFTFFDYAVDYRQADGFRVLDTQRVWWADSRDGGRTLSIPYLVDEKKLEGWSAVAVDASTGPFAGRLYATYHDLREGSGGIFVNHSTDGGETWSDAVRVGAPFELDRGFPIRNANVAVNGRGEVLVTWFASAEEPGASCGRLAASVSIDGGKTFLPPVPVADVSSCSDTPGNVVEQPGGPFDVAGRWAQGGDYYGVTALPDGSFRALWSDSRTGVFQLWTDRIEVRRAQLNGGPVGRTFHGRRLW